MWKERAAALRATSVEGFAPNPYIRFMANYIHVLDIEGGLHDDEDLDIFQVRAQVAY